MAPRTSCCQTRLLDWGIGSGGSPGATEGQPGTVAFWVAAAANRFVLLDILTDDPVWGAWSQQAVARARE